MGVIKEFEECEYYEQKVAFYQYQLKKLRKRLNKVKFNYINICYENGIIIIPEEEKSLNSNEEEGLNSEEEKSLNSNEEEGLNSEEEKSLNFEDRIKLCFNNNINLKEYLEIMIPSSIGVLIGTNSFMENPTISEFVRIEIINLIASYIGVKSTKKLFDKPKIDDIDIDLYDLELDDLAMLIYDLEEKEKNARREVSKIINNFMGKSNKNKIYVR